ncbi:PREDICTED: fibroblast growth factor-binding protein 2 [Cyprinodon variegatus]|uniref:fibroblast growth factor-binding protein 2 n=1 Tax=Cyprinodon variegatus TaxID=28743 RepID=UPI0007425D4E|nr:PREDICTED: fibroblast growth factor-binding protein 2 [Cyprinodon variegatus]XP_015239371.1 PREDICTED: fibroblast growth factor-binding protein 2 [Cyprinodon variegatus]
MRSRMKVMMLLLPLVAFVCVSNALSSDSSNDSKKQQPNIWDDTIRFNTKTKDSCTMAVSVAGNFTRVRVSCRTPSQTTGRSYYCDFQGKPTQCRAYNNNPRHYFTQMMWELRKLKNSCQGAKIYRPHMCRKYSDEAQMTFLNSWPKTSAPKPSKPVQEQNKPAEPTQIKPTMKPQKGKPQLGKGSQSKKSTIKPVKTTTLPTEEPESKVSRLATEYCWKSFHGLCSYVIGWFQN